MGLRNLGPLVLCCLLAAGCGDGVSGKVKMREAVFAGVNHFGGDAFLHSVTISGMDDQGQVDIDGNGTIVCLFKNGEAWKTVTFSKAGMTEGAGSAPAGIVAIDLAQLKDSDALVEAAGGAGDGSLVLSIPMDKPQVVVNGKLLDGYSAEVSGGLGLPE